MLKREDSFGGNSSQDKEKFVLFLQLFIKFMWHVDY